MLRLKALVQLTAATELYDGLPAHDAALSYAMIKKKAVLYEAEASYFYWAEAHYFYWAETHFFMD